jgi:hypothetical protein
MKFHGVACVKNEADIVEAFVRHNLGFLDQLRLIDHGSTDATPDILRRLQDEGLPLVVQRDESLGKLQGEKMTLLLRQAAQAGADWIFLLDADEFIDGPAPTLPPPPSDSPGVLKIAWQTYTAMPGDDAQENNPVLRIRHRLAREAQAGGTLEDRKYLLKCLVHRSVALDPRSVVIQGNHEVLIDGREVPHTLWDSCTLAHFSLRSPGQYASKVSVSALQKLARGTLTSEHSSFYWKHLEQIRRDYPAFAARFHEYLPAHFEGLLGDNERVEDPLNYRGGPLRQTPRRDDITVFIANLLNHAELLARTAAGHPSPQSDLEPARLTFGLGTTDDPEASGNGVEVSVGATAPSTVVIALPEPSDSLTLHWHLHGPMGLAECTGVRLVREDGSGEDLQGQKLLENADVQGEALRVPHCQYLTFVKGMGCATVVLHPGRAGRRGPWQRLKIRLLYDTRSATLGLRYFQSRPFQLHRQQAESLAHWKHQAASLATPVGFLSHHWRQLFRAGGR